jgi:endoglucanase
LKKGKLPWFDARIIVQFKDAAGKDLTSKPSPSYTQKDTAGWVDRTFQFLVPEGAATVVLMPTLFQVEAGTFDLDNFSLKPTDPAALLEAKKESDRAAANRYVPPEEPNKAKWPKMLKVEGNHLVDSDGKTVWLQGVNCGNLETLPADKQVIKSTVVAIDEWKSNCIRLPVKEDFWFGQSPYQKDGGKDYRDTIDQIVTLAANRGAYVVLDLHRFRAPKQEHADFWKDAAEHFKDHPAVLFDLFNEPHGISWEVWKKGGFVGEKEGTDESAFLTEEDKKKNQGFQSVGMQALIDAARSTGAKNIVIVGGLFWCNDLSGILKGYALEDKTGNGIMYSWHTYNWHPGWARVIPVLEKYPLFLGEVGADIKKMDFIKSEIQEDPYTFVPDMLGFIQKYKINWTGWCLHPRATPVLISDWNYTPTPYWGEFAKRALAGEQFEMKKMR